MAKGASVASSVKAAQAGNLAGLTLPTDGQQQAPLEGRTEDTAPPSRGLDDLRGAVEQEQVAAPEEAPVDEADFLEGVTRSGPAFAEEARQQVPSLLELSLIHI